MNTKKYLMIPFGIVIATVATLSIVSVTAMVSNADDSNTNQTIEVQDVEVNENDKKSPTIKIKDNISLEEESKFKLSDYVTATDASGNSLTVTAIDSVDTKKVGDQTITVTATDTNGNFTQKDVKVTITAKPTPTPEAEEQAQPAQQQQATTTNRTYSNNNQSQSYTPSTNTYQAPQAPVEQAQPAQQESSTYYAPEENSSSGSGFYASEGACRAAHSTGQCIPVVGDASGYTWQP